MSCDSCTNDKKAVQQMTQAQIDSMLIAQSRNFHLQEKERIQKFVSEKQWPTKVTGTGIHYWVYENGTGETAKTEQVAMVEYEVSLLDGTVVYMSQPGEKVMLRADCTKPFNSCVREIERNLFCLLSEHLV
jgi:FKBP-type peptidyl-prolyl cis-trans isomerase